MAVTDKPLEDQPFNGHNAPGSNGVGHDATTSEAVSGIDPLHFPQNRSLKEFSKWEASKSSTQGLVDGAITYGAMGLLGGLLLGGGLLVAAAFSFIAIPSAIGALSLFGAVVAGSTALSSLYGMHEWKENGRIGGGVGAAVEQLREDIAHMVKGESRTTMRTMAAALDVEDRVKAASPEVYEELPPLTNPYAKAGAGPNMAAATAPTTKLFHWKTALIGLAIAGGIGALIATGLGVGIPLLMATQIPVVVGMLEGTHLAVAGTYAAGHLGATMLGGGLGLGTFGAIYGGTDRSVMRRFMDKTRGLVYGEITPKHHAIHPVQPSLAPQRSIAPLSATTALATLNTEVAAAETAPNRFTERFAKSATPSEASPDRWQKIELARKAMAEMDTQEVVRH